MDFIIENGEPLRGVLTYSASEYGFSYTARSGEELQGCLGSKGVTSASVDTLQLEVDIESGRVLYAWGYFPIIRARVSRLNFQKVQNGRVRVSTNFPCQPGVSFDVPGEIKAIVRDPSSDWVLIQLKEVADATFVRIADGVVLGISDGKLVSVCLQPVLVD